MTGKEQVGLAKWLTIAVGIIGTIFTAFSINWGAVAQFAESTMFVYDHAEELEHVLDDFHQVMHMESEITSTQNQLDSLKRVLFEVRSRDSLISVINHLNRGKFPYDSIWVKGPSGTWYMTTMKHHFENDHEN